MQGVGQAESAISPGFGAVVAAALQRVRGLASNRARVVLAAGGFAVATLATRLPLRGSYLFNWDALQFALGIQQFNLATHRPHPPGYIGYVYLGRLLVELTGASTES